MAWFYEPYHQNQTMKLRTLFLIFFCVISFSSIAQDTATVHKHKHKSKTKAKTAKIDKPLPPWAAAHNYDATEHVYFPDYYTFYDAGRGGYVFWKDTGWSFTPAMPPYMEKVDLSKERVQILKGLSLDLQPQLNYPNYMEQYPAQPGYNKVPVPGSPADK